MPENHEHSQAASDLRPGDRVRITSGEWEK